MNEVVQSTGAGESVGTTRVTRPLDLSPAPGAAAVPRRVLAYAVLELSRNLRNGEQLLLSMAIPIGVLALLSTVRIVDLGRHPVDFVAPGVLALAVLSTAFTGQAIGTGFERRYGALKRFGATPLGRPGLLAGKTLAVLGIEAIQVVVLCAIAVALGWRPHLAVGGSILLLVLGTAAFSGLGLLIAGTLRAEATLAGANLVYVIFLAVGGIVFPVRVFPAGVRQIVDLLPVNALANGLRALLQQGAALPLASFAILAGWAVAALLAASLTFRWD